MLVVLKISKCWCPQRHVCRSVTIEEGRKILKGSYSTMYDAPLDQLGTKLVATRVQQE